MFQELMPLLGQRIVILVLSRVSDDEMRINVVPKPLKSDEPDDGAALTTPLSATGTPKELDEHLPGQLVEFVETHLGLSSTLKSEATDGGCRQSSKGSSQEINQLKIPRRIEQKCNCKRSADSAQRERKLRRFTIDSCINAGIDCRH